MKNKLNKSFFSLALIAGIFASSSALSNIYMGANYALMDLSGKNQYSASALNLRLGKDWDDNFSAEIRLGFGLDDDNAVEQDITVGAYMKFGAQASENFVPYLLVGFTKVSDLATDNSVGLGADFNVSDFSTLSLEYMKHIEKNNINVSALSIGLKTNF
ncbi:MAG: outer membrane beta-barrel protein [Porticoccaceae bacterium]